MPPAGPSSDAGPSDAGSSDADSGSDAALDVVSDAPLDVASDADPPSPRLLVCIDDTDDLDAEVGTGRRSRRLVGDLADAVDGLDSWGVVRQQLLVDPRVPYTTHNSCACLVYDVDRTGGDDADATVDADAHGEETDGDGDDRHSSPGDDPTAPAVDRAAVVAEVVDYAGPYLVADCAPGADPGLCVAWLDEVPDPVAAFGRRATEEVVAEAEASELADAAGLFLDEYGGTGEGVIGALAGVGLTAGGDSGRLLAYATGELDLRSLSGRVPVARLRERGVRVVDRAGDPVREGTLDTRDWVRPELRDWTPTLEVVRAGDASDGPGDAREHDWVATNALDR